MPSTGRRSNTPCRRRSPARHCSPARRRAQRVDPDAHVAPTDQPRVRLRQFFAEEPEVLRAPGVGETGEPPINGRGHDPSRRVGDDEWFNRAWTHNDRRQRTSWASGRPAASTRTIPPCSSVAVPDTRIPIAWSAMFDGRSAARDRGRDGPIRRVRPIDGAIDCRSATAAVAFDRDGEGGRIPHGTVRAISVGWPAVAPRSNRAVDRHQTPFACRARESPVGLFARRGSWTVANWLTSDGTSLNATRCTTTAKLVITSAVRSCPFHRTKRMATPAPATRRTSPGRAE